ncbi:disease resistance protein RUN1 [Cryptomeria japonica]|uniref:disease resistance protein RUN1 n=1 Tax=Cryptomeria japonica TaxID=3369 RepID=UPI0025ACA8C1|nr:disease resistance protein RUN1 [Cryptomeria japonica]
MSLEVAMYPVGLDELVRDFENTLQSAGPAKIVGIFGMGGVGKTTLAKELYNRKVSTFDRSSFVFDVSEAARKGRLHEKQKKLLKDLDLEGKYIDFDNVKEGKEILKSRLRSVPMLIVLDDVDDPDQLNALLPARESLGQGSQIIVTTRHLDVLTASGISTTYEMRPPNPPHAEQLFSWHAFRQPSPLSGFEDLTKSFINACQDLPLSLAVLGSLLYGEPSKNIWQSQLNKILKILPEDTKSKLKISYDALDKTEKDMFLVVACFFIGEKRSLAIEVWDALGWNGLHGWRRLVDKALVVVDHENCIRMQNDLRDF